MAVKSLNFQLDDDQITVTLSNSARISLSDITAATIGNLSEDSQWANNSVSTPDAGQSVLRPWEDNSVPVQTAGYSNVQQEYSNVQQEYSNIQQEYSNVQQEYSNSLPPTYQEHVKRHFEEDESNDQYGVPKRPKLQSTSFSNVGVPYSHGSQNTSQKPIQQSITQNSRHQATTQNSIQQVVNQNVRKVLIQNSKQSESTNNYTNKEFLQNSMQKVDTQNSIQRKQSITEQSYTSGQTVNKNYLPWTNSSVLTASNNILTTSNNVLMASNNVPTASTNRQQAGQTATPNKMMNESTLMKHAMPYPPNVQIFQPIPVHQTAQTYQMPLLYPAPVYQQLPKTTLNPHDDHKPKQMSWPENTLIPPSNIHHLPKLHLAPTFQPSEVNLQISDILQNTSQSEEHGKPVTWQNASTVNVSDETNVRPVVEFKQEPVTPAGKGLMSSSIFDSPGIDSRFSESLSNLLGSPPSESPLSKNPFLGDLQALLQTECKREIVPQSLFVMQGTSKQNIDTKNKSLNVFQRERNLQERFTSLQSHHAEDVRQLSSMFRYQSALIETERFRTLHECQYPGSYKQSVNYHYDNQLHNVMDRVERSVQLLETSNKENRSNKTANAKVRPHLSKESVRLMESWYQQNLLHPYPTNSVIEMLAQAGNIGIEQVKKWFANKRNRSANTRTLTAIAMQKRRLGQMPGTS